MTTLTIKVPQEAKEKLSAIVKEMGGEIVSKISKKDKLLKEIKKGLKEVKKIREGKAPAFTMADLFDGKSLNLI